MPLNSPVTELTTAATDALLAVLCLALMPGIGALLPYDRWKASLWLSVFGLLAVASLLGAVVHGFALTPRAQVWLWQPLYLALGLVVALFVVATVRDWLGEAAARQALLPAVAVGVLFWVTSRLLGGDFRIFVVYAGVAMLAALAMYVTVAWRGSVPGAATIAAGIVVTLAANAVQATRLQVTVIWPFDHNGLFHLVQMAAVVLLQVGVRASVSAQA